MLRAPTARIESTSAAAQAVSRAATKAAAASVSHQASRRAFSPGQIEPDLAVPRSHVQEPVRGGTGPSHRNQVEQDPIKALLPDRDVSACLRRGQPPRSCQPERLSQAAEVPVRQQAAPTVVGELRDILGTGEREAAGLQEQLGLPLVDSPPYRGLDQVGVDDRQLVVAGERGIRFVDPAEPLQQTREVEERPRVVRLKGHPAPERSLRRAARIGNLVCVVLAIEDLRDPNVLQRSGAGQGVERERTLELRHDPRRKAVSMQSGEAAGDQGIGSEGNRRSSESASASAGGSLCRVASRVRASRRSRSGARFISRRMIGSRLSFAADSATRQA